MAKNEIEVTDLFPFFFKNNACCKKEFIKRDQLGTLN
jgi:hypothetical protein